MRKTEEQDFEMDPQLLFDVIQRQAGTLEKAIAEGVMNAADAKATVCNITVSDARVIVDDNGRGFPSREEIDKFFKRFGTPHTESEGKIYGTFRMGRGQLFKFGVNNWRSGLFEMDVDIKTRGLRWTLHTHTADAPGCKVVIDLYDKLSPGAKAAVLKEVTHLVRYMEINGPEVYLNGEKVSVDPVEETWDYTLPEGFVKLRRTGNLDVYNLGVLVKGYPCERYGTGGTVVSSQQLKVNFARNDVMVNECKVWKALMKNVGTYARERIERTPTLNNSERARLAQDILDEEVEPREAIQLKVFTDVCGRHWSIQRLLRKMWQHRSTLSLADQGNNVGDTLHKMGAAFVLGSDTADRFDMDLPELSELIHKLHKKAWGYVHEFKAMEFSELAQSLDNRGVIVPEDQWTPGEKIMMSLLAGAQYGLSHAVGKATGVEIEYGKQRKLCVGSAETMSGWTNGLNYIAIERRLLTLSCLTLRGVMEAHRVLLHELCHDAPSTSTHQHSHEFYQIFHDCDCERDRAVVAAMARLPKAVESVGAKLTPKQLRDLDYLFQAEQGVTKLTQKVAACASKAQEAGDGKG